MGRVIDIYARSILNTRPSFSLGVSVIFVGGCSFKNKGGNALGGNTPRSVMVLRVASDFLLAAKKLRGFEPKEMRLAFDLLRQSNSELVDWALYGIEERMEGPRD